MVRIKLSKGESFAVHEDRIIVSVEAKQEKTASGIILPEDSEEKGQVGIVYGIGDDPTIYVKKGDRIVFNKFAGNEIAINDQVFMIMRISDVLGTVEKGDK